MAQILTEDESVVLGTGGHVNTSEIKFNDGAREVNATVANFSVHQ